MIAFSFHRWVDVRMEGGRDTDEPERGDEKQQVRVRGREGTKEGRDQQFQPSHHLAIVQRGIKTKS